MRHAARSHPGAREVGSGAGAARAPAPARRPAPRRPRMGDAAVARSGWLGGVGRRPRPSQPRGRGRALRRPSAPRCAGTGPVSGRGHAGGAGRGRAVSSARYGSTRDRKRCRGRRRWTRTMTTRPTTRPMPPTYFAAATRAAMVLAALRAPYRGRSSPVNAWWGTFDLAVSLFSGRPVDPPSDGFITRNSANGRADRGRLVAGRRALSARRVLRVCVPDADGVRVRHAGTAGGALGHGAR